jgi:hypothetical protein
MVSNGMIKPHSIQEGRRTTVQSFDFHVAAVFAVFQIKEA